MRGELTMPSKLSGKSWVSFRLRRSRATRQYGVQYDRMWERHTPDVRLWLRKNWMRMWSPQGQEHGRTVGATLEVRPHRGLVVVLLYEILGRKNTEVDGSPCVVDNGILAM